MSGLASLAAIAASSGRPAPLDAAPALNLVFDNRPYDGARAGESLRRKPAASEPLLRRALAAWRGGEAQIAEAALAEAVRRDPRSIPAWALRAEMAIASRDPAAFADAIERLHDVNPSRSRSYAALLTDFIEIGAGEEALLTPILDDERWLRAVFAELRRRRAPASVWRGLAIVSDAARPDYLAALIAQDRVADAFSAFLSFLPESRLADLSWPIDAGFTEIGRYPPFTWRLGARNAELLSEGGLYASYNGRGKPVLAEQVMPLGPGRYRFTAEMDGRATPQGGALIWRIDCIGADRKRLGEIAPEGVGDTPRAFAFDFVVPATGCRFQRLALAGAPGVYAKPARVVTRRVAIAHLGA